MATLSLPSSSFSSVRPWRTAFLTLRDETLNSPPCATVIHLLNHLIFSHSETLMIAASDLPSREVTSDLMFLMELARTAADSSGNDDITVTFTQLSNLVYVVSRRVSLDMNSSYWVLMLDTFRRMMEIFLGNSGRKRISLGNVVVRAVKNCLETIRYLTCAYQRKCLISENTELINFLLSIVTYSHTELFGSSYAFEIGKSNLKHNGLWEVQTTTFSMIGELFSRAGSSLSTDTWQSTVLVIKRVMDALASKNLLVEDNAMARFYASLLHCLHLVLIDPKGPLSDNVAGFVAALRMFFIYGITDRSQLVCPSAGRKKETSSTGPKLVTEESGKSVSGPYRPPHLRKQDLRNLQLLKDQESASFLDQEYSTIDYTSSDSDYSDSDGPTKDLDSGRCSKARVSAIVCIQDLCRADPKLFMSQLTMILPSSDVLQPRKYEATLMTCLLFDPYLKARLASATALMAILDGPASVFLQVAEYKESTKCGSFTALSSLLGQILMQLHTGILHMIHHETHSGLLASSFKILMLLILCTPYSRMPKDLLPIVISALQKRIEEGFPLRSDQPNLMTVAINCLTAALSSSPSSPAVKDLLVAESYKGSVEAHETSGVLTVIFRYSEAVNNPIVCLEALQGNGGSVAGSIGEKVVTAAIKALDECLRAISGFKGTEDLFSDKLLDTPFTSDYVRTKKISSAPLHGSESIAVMKGGLEICTSGIKQWSETIEKHMPLVLTHTSAMVRAASITCFAGITSSVFSSLSKEKQEFILSSSINAALNDEAPSVRSAACRAIGVITCFPQISESAEILGKFVHAAESNTHDQLVLVRITASWALANICDSFRHYIHAVTSRSCSIDSKMTSPSIAILVECALRLTKDSDKVKANAVRALGNISRFVQFRNRLGASCEPDNCNDLSLITKGADSCCLGRMVQAFLSCVATGNVKVQWNVCHALCNLFLNETLKLGDMDWAPSVFSILLLLLRDSPNYKIRIQAAAALAVPATLFDYGGSFSDVIQGVVHAVENLSSDQIPPSSFKYRIALEKQLTSTMLHVLALASNANQSVKDFLVKKASFLEEWFGLCLRGETDPQLEGEKKSTENQKKEMISSAIRSLIEVYEGRSHLANAQKFNKLANSIP
ncbi:hypothetical protein NMG60_11028837 [Bertholletia excelsa]